MRACTRLYRKPAVLLLLRKISVQTWISTSHPSFEIIAQTNGRISRRTAFSRSWSRFINPLKRGKQGIISSVSVCKGSRRVFFLEKCGNNRGECPVCVYCVRLGRLVLRHDFTAALTDRAFQLWGTDLTLRPSIGRTNGKRYHIQMIEPRQRSLLQMGRGTSCPPPILSRSTSLNLSPARQCP